MSDLLAELNAICGGRAPPEVLRNGVSHTPELDRIIQLPRRKLDLDAIPDLTPLYATDPAASLRKIQSAMLWEGAGAGGLLAPATVGCGKTLTTLLLPDAMRSRCAVLLVPPMMRDQLQLKDIPFYGQSFRLPLGILHIVAYTYLQSEAGQDILERLQPDLVICDEAHWLRNKASGRWRRVKRYANKRPDCRWCFLSGTFTSRSIKDYSHLSELAFRKNSPVPTSYYTITDWAAAIDAGENPLPPGALMLLCQPGETVREGYQRRLRETRGVVISQTTTCDASLVLRERPQTLPASIQALMNLVDTTWALGGEEFMTAMEKTSAMRQLACGFYYRWDWGNRQPDEEWIEAKAAWCRVGRRYLLTHNVEGRDTFLLLSRAAKSGAWADGASAWAAWERVRDRKGPATVPVWVSDYLIQDALLWASEEEEPGIIWYEHDAVGRALRDAGLPTFGGGADSKRLLAATAATHRVIACSRTAHGAGKNLQDWCRFYVLSPMANGIQWEQTIGREHRDGQLADLVTGDVNLHTRENRAAWDQALRDAEYILATTGAPQKLLLATRVVN